METASSLNNFTIKTIEEIGKRTSAITKEPLETSYLFERISMAIQRKCSFILEHISDRLKVNYNQTIFP